MMGTQSMNKLGVGTRVVISSGSPYFMQQGVKIVNNKKVIIEGNIAAVMDLGENEYNFQVIWDDGNRNDYRLNDLKVVKKQSSSVEIKYQPGSSVTEYVKKLIGIETDGERRKWLQTFDNCILPKDVRDAIDEALTVILQSHMFDDWGINEHFEKGLTNSILLYGPPGTGKTMVAESIAAVLDKNIMVIGSGELQSNIPGQTEKNIQKAFQQATKENAVLMFDECDSILADRNHVGTILAAEINCLLQEIERFEGVCVLTTNRLHSLDPALQRRIIAKVELGQPSMEAREQIWKKLLPPKMPIEELDYKELAAAELTGGEIKNAILLSARKAIARNETMVSRKTFQEAIAGVVKAKTDYARTRPRAVEGMKPTGTLHGDLTQLQEFAQGSSMSDDKVKSIIKDHFRGRRE